MNEKFKDDLRKLHDEVKNHIFWITLSNDFHADCVNKLKELMNTFISHFSKDDIDRCPQAVILLRLMHNTFDMILKAKLMPKYHHQTIMETKAFGNYILCLQTCLQLIHYYLDNIFDEESVVGYNPYLHFDDVKEVYTTCDYQTFGARENGDGTYRLVRVIKKEEVNGLIEYNTNAAVEYAKMVKYFVEHNQEKYAECNLKKAKYHEECVEDLKNNKAKHFIIK